MRTYLLLALLFASCYFLGNVVAKSWINTHKSSTSFKIEHVHNENLDIILPEANSCIDDTTKNSKSNHEEYFEGLLLTCPQKNIECARLYIKSLVLDCLNSKQIRPVQVAIVQCRTSITNDDEFLKNGMLTILKANCSSPDGKPNMYCISSYVDSLILNCVLSTGE